MTGKIHCCAVSQVDLTRPCMLAACLSTAVSGQPPQCMQGLCRPRLIAPKLDFDRCDAHACRCLPADFEDEASCQKYLANQTISGIILLTTKSGSKGRSAINKVTGKNKRQQNIDDLLLGCVDLASLTFFQESFRLDLRHRAMELKTPRRTWVLQVVGAEDYYRWFHAIWRALVLCNNQSVKMSLPNVWIYRMPGKLKYRFVFCLFVVASLWWLYQLLVAGYPGLQPCVEKKRFINEGFTCADIATYGERIGYHYDTAPCRHSVATEWWWYGTWNPFFQGSHCNIDVVEHYPSKPPIYWFFVIAEFLNVGFALSYYLGLWRMTRRGARYAWRFAMIGDVGCRLNGWGL